MDYRAQLFLSVLGPLPRRLFGSRRKLQLRPRESNRQLGLLGFFSAPEFLDSRLLGNIVLVANEKLGLCCNPSTQEVRLFKVTRASAFTSGPLGQLSLP